MTWRYNQLVFDSSCYPVDRWLEDRSTQLSAMAPSGVLVVSLQVNKFHQLPYIRGVTLIDSIVTAATALVNPYTKEGVESLRILPYTSINVCIVNG